jgi:hypothetical protein
MRGMQLPTKTPLDEAFQPYRHLAVRVLACAFQDLANPMGSRADRESARAFLAGSAMLVHWCRVAALDPSCVVNRAEKLTEGLSTSQSEWLSCGDAAPERGNTRVGC